jgi:MauM/NapG family ferredoxin protein
MPTSRRTFFAIGLGFCGGAGAGALFRKAGCQEQETLLLRPPGALKEDRFLAACVRCGQCAEACPFDTLLLAAPDKGIAFGTPYLKPDQIPCYLCEGYDELKCIEVCPTSALKPVENLKAIRMGTARIDREICWAYNRVICRSCWHACPFPDEAIYFDELLRPVVNESVCIGCGLCTLACPTDPTSIPIEPRSAAKKEGGP